MIVFFENNYMYYPKRGGFPLMKSISLDKVQISYDDLEIGGIYFVNSKKEHRFDEFSIVRLEQDAGEYHFTVIKGNPFDSGTLIIRGMDMNDYKFYKNAFNKENNITHDYFRINENGKNKFQLSMYKTGVISVTKR